jgi:5-methylcytosine-specific restriction endonuclease McrA
MAKERCCTTRHSGTHEEFNEQRRGYMARWKAAHSESAHASLVKWRQSPKGKSWALEYRERQRENWKSWYRRDLEHGRASKVAGQARRRAGTSRPDSLTTAYIAILRRDPCAYCGSRGGVVDHIDPISKGGLNHWTNLTAACQACNSSKHTKPLLAVLS